MAPRIATHLNNIYIDNLHNLINKDGTVGVALTRGKKAS